MNAATAGWLFFRALRWAAWIFFLAFSCYFLMDRQRHIGHLGQLLPMTELMMFGPAVIGVFAGFFELMMRERADLPRPRIGQLIPPKAGPVGAVRVDYWGQAAASSTPAPQPVHRT